MDSDSFLPQIRLNLLACVLLLGIGTTFTQPVAGGYEIDRPGSPMELTMEVDFDLPKGYKLKPTVDLTKWLPPAGNQHGNFVRTWKRDIHIRSRSRAEQLISCIIHNPNKTEVRGTRTECISCDLHESDGEAQR